MATAVAMGPNCGPDLASLLNSSPESLVGPLAIYAIVYTNVAYPSALVPNGVALKPTQAPQSLPPGAYNIDPASFFIAVCNLSSDQSVTISQLSLQITSFTPIVGTLDIWQFCNAYFDAGAKNLGGGGCGGGYNAFYTGTSTWPTALVKGASVPIQVQPVSYSIGSPNAASGPLPVTLQPHQYMLSDLNIAYTASPGTVSMQLVVTLANHTTALGPISGPFTFAPAREWSGTNCETPTMLKQITATSGNYICPPAP